jgi:hypothetical protein
MDVESSAGVKERKRDEKELKCEGKRTAKRRNEKGLKKTKRLYNCRNGEMKKKVKGEEVETKDRKRKKDCRCDYPIPCCRRVECGRCVKLTISPPSVSRLYRQCEILSISQPYTSPRTVTLIFTFT